MTPLLWTNDALSECGLPPKPVSGNPVYQALSGEREVLRVLRRNARNSADRI